MSKTSVTVLLLVGIIISLALNIFFGRFLIAEISTVPVFNRLKLLSPQAPIVINTREEVRTGASDVTAAISASKAKISTLLAVSGGKILPLGGAVNLTNDGLFLVPKSLLASHTSNELFIMENDGATGAVVSASSDPATSLAVIKTNLNNVSTAALGNSSALSTGQPLLVLYNGSLSFQPSFQESFVSTSQQDVFSKIFFSDQPSRTFGVQITGTIPVGAGLFDMNSKLVGIWDGHEIISSDVISDGLSVYTAGAIRPSFGFYYQYNTELEQNLLKVPTGVVIATPAVVTGSPADKAGLKVGDVLTQVDGQKISTDNLLEPLLEKYKPGDVITLTVVRGQVTITLKLTAGILK